MLQNPAGLLYRALELLLSRRIRFRRPEAPPSTVDGGERFTPFRKVALRPNEADPDPPGAVFRVRFRFKSFSARVNRVLSLIPIPFIVAQPGFRSKTWLLGDRTGEFMGYYEFDTIGQAEAYWDSLPLRLMRGRAAHGTLSCSVSRAGEGMNDVNENGNGPGVRR